VKANEADRLKCHIRRRDAFRNLEMWEEALTDSKEAIQLEPMSEELISVRDEIQMFLNREDRKNKEKVGERIATNTNANMRATSSDEED